MGKLGGGGFTFEVQTRPKPSEKKQNTTHVRVKTDFEKLLMYCSVFLPVTFRMKKAKLQIC